VKWEKGGKVRRGNYIYIFFFCVEKEDGSSGRGMGVGMDWTNLAQDRDR